MHTIVETPAFLADAERLFDLEEREALLQMIAGHPECGVLIPGTGGVRKVRFGFGGRGKRGGARVIYLFAGPDMPIFLLAAFAKNERADLSGSERSALAGRVDAMISRYRRRR